MSTPHPEATAEAASGQGRQTWITVALTSVLVALIGYTSPEGGDALRTGRILGLAIGLTLLAALFALLGVAVGYVRNRRVETPSARGIWLAWGAALFVTVLTRVVF